MCSSFNCEKCGKAIIDTPYKGYITECKHYPMKSNRIFPKNMSLLKYMIKQIKAMRKLKKTKPEKVIKSFSEQKRINVQKGIKKCKSCNKAIDGIITRIYCRDCTRVQHNISNRKYQNKLKKKEEKPKKCCLCSNAHDNWPHDKSGGYLCQDCWEKQCDKNWWL